MHVRELADKTLSTQLSVIKSNATYERMRFGCAAVGED